VPSSSEGGIIRDLREIVAERTAGAFGEEMAAPDELATSQTTPQTPPTGASATASRAPSTAASPELRTVSHAELEALAPMLEDDVLGSSRQMKRSPMTPFIFFLVPYSMTWRALFVNHSMPNQIT
jgi:hypothetical protein